MSKGKCQFCGQTYSYKSIGQIMDQGIKVPDYECDCMKKHLEEERKSKHIEKVGHLYRESKVDRFWLESKFKVYNKKLIPYYENLDWIKNGIQLLCYGGPGNHKTGQVTSIAKKVMRYLHSVKYFRANDIPHQWKQYNKMKTCSLLIIDNFGLEVYEGSRGSLFEIVDYRIHNYKSTIIISNGDLDDINEIYKTPFVSRLKCFTAIEIDGEDKRIEKYGRSTND